MTDEAFWAAVQIINQAKTRVWLSRMGSKKVSLAIKILNRVMYHINRRRNF